MDDKLGRTRQRSTSSDAEDSKRSKPDEKMTTEVAASPPSFVNFDKLMETLQRDTQAMQLAHEIAVDPEFKLQKNESASNSLYSKVQQNMRKAYWDIIKEDISKTPPVLDMVLKLCNDMRQLLLDLLLPHQNKMRERITELFDIDLIRQQCENAKSLDPLKEYAPTMLDFMQRLCCPMRDDEIQALRLIDDTAELFQGIIQVLEEMKLDYSNFLISKIRPVVKDTIVSYEKDQMKKIQSTRDLIGLHDCHKLTREWLRRAFEDLCSVNSHKPTAGAILLQGYMQVVFQNQYITEEWDLPETLALDRERVQKLQQTHVIITIAAASIWIAQAYLPKGVDTNHFKRKMKEVSLIILEDVRCSAEAELREALSNLVTKFFQDIQKETNASLSKQQEVIFHSQIMDLQNLSNPVRNLIFSRIVAFVSQIAKGTQNVKVPPGFSVFEVELTKFAADFLKIISLNRATQCEIYDSILVDSFASSLDDINSL